MGNPRKFSRIARNLALIKPVIVVKSGRLRLRRPAGPPGAPHQGTPRGVRGDAQAGRRDAGRERAPALRHRPAGRPPAAARRRPGRRRRQLDGAGHAHRRRVHELGPHRVARPGRAAHRGHGRPVPHGARRGVRRPQGRLGADLLHPTAGDQRRGRRGRRARCRRRFREALCGNVPRHARGRRRPRLGDRHGRLDPRHPGLRDARGRRARARRGHPLRPVAGQGPRHAGGPRRASTAASPRTSCTRCSRSTRRAAGSPTTRSARCCRPTASTSGARRRRSRPTRRWPPPSGSATRSC